MNLSLTTTSSGSRTVNRNKNELSRSVSLPFLVFYGIGVTVGAGIFALSGEVVALAGQYATWSFLIAGVIAGLTAVSYSVLSSKEARAAGEAWYVAQVFGRLAGVLVGLLLVLTAIFSSAAIAVAFANYTSTLIGVPLHWLIVAVLSITTLVALKGIRETVIFSAVVTLIEVGALLVIIAVGMPSINEITTENLLFPMPTDQSHLAIVLSGALLAFFAFIGFEDIVNMGDEAINAKRNLPIAIMCTLVITLVIYLLVALVCVAMPDRQALISSSAPLAYVFEINTGRNAGAITLCAAIAMINGILVQLVMASRVLFGLARDSSLPAPLAYVHEQTRTPVIAIAVVSILVILCSLSFSLVGLARYSSIVLLSVFAMVNLSLALRARQIDSGISRYWQIWGWLAFLSCIGLIGWQLLSGYVSGGH